MYDGSFFTPYAILHFSTLPASIIPIRQPNWQVHVCLVPPHLDYRNQHLEESHFHSFNWTTISKYILHSTLEIAFRHLYLYTVCLRSCILLTDLKLTTTKIKDHWLWYNAWHWPLWVCYHAWHWPLWVCYHDCINCSCL